MCDDVAEWAATHQGAVPTIVLGAQSYAYVPPRTVEPHLLPTFTAATAGTWRARALVPVDNARIIGRNGLVVLPDGSYSAEWWYTADKVRGEPDYDAPPRRPTVHKAGSYFPLLISHLAGAGNYYHWLHDTMSRYFGVAELLPPDVKFIVSRDLAPFQRESLRCFGIEPERTVTFDATEVWELEQLWFAGPACFSGRSRPEVCAWLRDTLLDAYSVEHRAATRRLYISRRNTG